jgi:MFS family permease
MSAGALIAGKLSDKKSKKTVLQLNLLFCILVSMIVALLYDIQSSLSPLIIFYIVFYFFIGSTTASLYSLLMRLTSKEFAALEFSIFMGVVNLSDSNISYLTGLLVENYSYSISVIVIGLLSSLSFLGLKRINI